MQVKAIYVGNLPETVTEEKLRDVFKAYGEVSTASSNSSGSSSNSSGSSSDSGGSGRHCL
jgi:RNA recognition motif-containing protein